MWLVLPFFRKLTFFLGRATSFEGGVRIESNDSLIVKGGHILSNPSAPFSRENIWLNLTHLKGKHLRVIASQGHSKSLTLK